jgi:hypothetical protein
MRAARTGLAAQACDLRTLTEAPGLISYTTVTVLKGLIIFKHGASHFHLYWASQIMNLVLSKRQECGKGWGVNLTVFPKLVALGLLLTGG